jgi:hypothetical protein
MPSYRPIAARIAAFLQAFGVERQSAFWRAQARGMTDLTVHGETWFNPVIEQLIGQRQGNGIIRAISYSPCKQFLPKSMA